MIDDRNSSRDVNLNTAPTTHATGADARHWVDASCAQWAAGDLASALTSSLKALEIDPRCVDALVNAGTIRWVMGDEHEAEQLYEQAHAIDPAHVGVLLNIAMLANDAGDVDTAMEWIAKARVLRPGDREVAWRNSLFALALGDYVNGWRDYELGLGVEALRGKSPGFTTTPWRGNPCHRLLLWHEQGFGDTVQFIRYAKLCRERARRVEVLCPPELVRLLRSCPFVDDARANVGSADIDEHCPLLSLPYRFGTTMETIPAPIPYLYADTDRAREYGKRMAGGRLKVGLVWAGNFRTTPPQTRIIDRNRNLAFSAMRPWLDTPGVAFYSLQKGDTAGEARGSGVIDFMSEVRDFADTAAIIANLDLVVSADTAVAHIAGAMGKPVWVLSRAGACWRWLRNRRQSPWYPTATVFGQARRGDWSDVIAKVGFELARL